MKRRNVIRDAMERYTYPHTIDNGAGERITFLRKVPSDAGERLSGAEELVLWSLAVRRE